MRLYVYCESDEPSVDPFILAEVVRDTEDDRSLSLAAALAGPRSCILTRRELLQSPQRRVALEAWDARDDTMFERESSLLARTGRVGAVRLHIVNAEDREPVKRIYSHLPMDRKMRETVLMSRGLREVTRQVIQRARALRLELQEQLNDERTAGDQVGN
jgi:hypothetical protein